MSDGFVISIVEKDLHMEAFLSKLAAFNDALNTFIWVKIGLALLLGTGVLMSVATNFFQITHRQDTFPQFIF